MNPLANGSYVLEGRLMTMGPQGVIPKGAIYIEAGEIKAVQTTAAKPPPGFHGTPRIRTGDTLYPGLIELHNHLSYNAMPLWDVPKKYANNGQWRGKESYSRDITKPSQVLGGTAGVVEAMVRFVECRALLGGVTTSQGISLSSEPGIKKFYKGIVRNVEQALDPRLPSAGTRIGNPSTGKAAAYLRRLEKKSCYLQHLSEGIDRTARGWFLRLQLEGGEWAINPAFCGIHSTALNEDDFGVIAQRGGSMVWSPLSNYLLYGDTADMQAVKNSGILVGIGSDWAPSGSKNLLGELKVAWLASQAQDSVFTPQEIVAMATINGARIAKWDDHLGSIEPGKRADLVAINGRQGDDFMRLIAARESSVTMVVIDGVPRLYQRQFSTRFGPGTESIKIGRSHRVLNLAQEEADPLVGTLTLTEATQRLRDAMLNLPELALELDSAFGVGLFGGSEDSRGTNWRVLLDFEEDDKALDLASGLAGKPLSFFVEKPMELEEITVVDDRDHLPKLMAARNLPEFVKKGLPPLYGKTLPIPDAALFLEVSEDKLVPQLPSTTGDLKTFLRTWGELNLDDRMRIVDQALVLLEENYVHLPLKRAMHAVDPLQRLRLLRHRLDDSVEGELRPEIEFHNELTGIFNSLRDLHTAYRLPAPFKYKTAWLPFLVEEFWESGQRRYMVSKIVAQAGPETFQPGVEITHWNGTPIDQVVGQNAQRQAGSNEEARHARGLNSLTIRPLARGLPPEEEWVTLRYLDEEDQVHEWRQEWLVFEPGRHPNAVRPDDLLKEASALGLDDHTDDIQQVKKLLFAPPVALSEERARARNKKTAICSARGGGANLHARSLPG